MSKSSKGWLKEHFTDPYVKKAQQAGYRSRAVYKLIELQEKLHLFSSNMVVIELGAAPGGWSQLLAQWVKPKGQVIAIDLLPMEGIEGVNFIQGDFSDENKQENIKQYLNNQHVDWVISDMAPNLSGNESIDMPRSMYLSELALEFALQVLKPSGGFLIKVFQGTGFDAFLLSLRKIFKKVTIHKPKASRARSKEIYLMGRGLKSLATTNSPRT